MPKGDPRDSLQFAPTGAHQSGTNISSPVTLTPPEDATKLLIQVINASARYTLDGSTPDIAHGFVLIQDSEPLLIPLSGTTIFKIVEVETGAELQYQWGKDG